MIIKIINRTTGFINKLYEYRTIYKLTGLVATRKFKEAKQNHRYAILIAARNEATVIGNLIDSIAMQDYPSELVTVFVVADNCTDNTAEIARQKGAVCYERQNEAQRTKGFALQYLVECIKRDYGVESFEGYFLFDADNLLARDYISRMNESFDAGEKIVTSYRNTKNFDDNWISASYAIHWLRTIRNEHRARSLFRLATRIQGTGFLFANELIKNGWNYTSLTEDRAFCADAVVNGYQISYNNAAVFYDEQPTDIKIAMRQRIRWAKGHLQALADSGPKLFLHIFATGKMPAIEEEKRKHGTAWAIFNNIRTRFMSFDMLTTVFPRLLMTFLKRWLVFILRLVAVLFFGKTFTAQIGPKELRQLLSFFDITPTADNTLEAAVLLVGFTLAVALVSYLNGIKTAIYIFIFEYKRISPMKLYKKIWFCITFPIFDLIGKLASFIALFTKVEWKPIPHNADIKITDINR